MLQGCGAAACISLALAIRLRTHFPSDGLSDNATLDALQASDSATWEDVETFGQDIGIENQTALQIFLAGQRGESTITNYAVNVTKTTTVNDLKLEFFDRTSFPVKDQILVLDGKQLKDDDTIGGLDITRGTTLRVTSGLAGGVAHAIHARWNAGFDFVGHLVSRTGIPFLQRQREQTCTALVQGSFGITAAHCFDQESGGHPKLDDWTLKTTSGDKRLVAGKIHDSYIPKQGAYDIAFFVLESPHIPRTRIVLDSSKVMRRQRVMMAGFGDNETGKAGNFGLAEFETCECPSWSQEWPVACAHTGPRSPVSTCGGDSGGPWWHFPTTEAFVRIFGVQAFGFDGGCGEPSKKSGIALLSGAEDWLRRHTPFEWMHDQSASSSSAMPYPGMARIADVADQMVGAFKDFLSKPMEHILQPAHPPMPQQPPRQKQPVHPHVQPLNFWSMCGL